MKISKAVGIDLGTTNSVIAMMTEDNQDIICNMDSHNRKTFPSVVVFDTKTNTIKSGQLAFNRRGTVPEPVVSIKRHMGDSRHTVDMGGRPMTPSEISAEVLREMKRQMEDYLHKQPGYVDYVVDRAVITVPAYFRSDAKEATTRAGQLAGLEVELTLQEPTASAMYYCFRNKIEDGTFMVYDLGGGTFDVSIVRMAGNAPDVIGIAGNNYLGGDNFDELLAHYLLEVLQDPSEGYELDLDINNDEEDARRFSRLKLEAEVIKKQLSTHDEYFASHEGIFNDKCGAKVNLSVTVTRKKFEELIRPVLETTVEECYKALEEAKKADITLEDITGVLLVGGSTHIPLVAEIIREAFTDPKLPIHTQLPEPLIDEPDMAVGYGAAIAASTFEMRRLSDAIHSGGTGEQALVLSVSTTPGVWAGVGKSTVKGKLTAVSGMLPAGITAKVERADGSFKAEFPVRADGEFAFENLPTKEGHEPYACAFWADGKKLLDSTFNGAVGDVGDVPVVLSRNYFIEITNPVTGTLEMFPLMSKGTPLPTSKDYQFRVLNEYLAELRFFEETTFLKKVPIIFESPIPAGTPITLSLSCDKKSIFSALATVAGKNIRIEFEPSPPPPMPTETEIRQQLARFEETKPRLQEGKSIAAQKKIERFVEVIHHAVDEKDIFKATDLFNDMIAYIDALQPVSKTLSPNQQEFNRLAQECERLNEESKNGSPENLADIHRLRSAGAQCYEKADQAGLTDAYSSLQKIRNMLSEIIDDRQPQTLKEQCVELCMIALAIMKAVDDRDWPEAFRHDKLALLGADQQHVYKIFTSMQFETNDDVISNAIVTVSKYAQKWNEIREITDGISH